MGRELLILTRVLERPRTLRRHEWGWQALDLWVWQEAQSEQRSSVSYSS